MGIPQNDLGIHTIVMDACPKILGMQMLARSMAPEVIAVDEIGTSKDLQTIAEMRNTGIKILATIHGDQLSDVRNRMEVREFLLETIFTNIIILKKVNGHRHSEIYRKGELIWQE